MRVFALTFLMGYDPIIAEDRWRFSHRIKESLWIHSHGNLKSNLWTLSHGSTAVRRYAFSRIRMMPILFVQYCSGVSPFNALRLDPSYASLQRTHFRSRARSYECNKMEFINRGSWREVSSVRLSTLNLWCYTLQFVHYLGREGKVTVEESPKGWYIRYIDKAEIERRERAAKKERAQLDEEER